MTRYSILHLVFFLSFLLACFQALGNHEFDNGVEGLKPFIRKVNCKVLSANIRPDDTLASQVEGLYMPYTIFNVSGERVGVVGYTSKETPALSQPGTWNMEYFTPKMTQFSPIEVLNTWRMKNPKDNA